MFLSGTLLAKEPGTASRKRHRKHSFAITAGDTPEAARGVDVSDPKCFLFTRLVVWVSETGVPYGGLGCFSRAPYWPNPVEILKSPL